MQGALTAAFSYLFNACGSGECGTSLEESGVPTGMTVADPKSVGQMMPFTSAADSAVDYWIARDNPVMGTLAMLWTPDYAPSTALLLGGGVAGMFRAYWQYYPAGVESYASNWLVRGWNPPYALGAEASSKLALPPYNPATAVRQVDVPFWQFVRGPGGVTPKYGQLGGGLEWWRGWRF